MAPTAGSKGPKAKKVARPKQTSKAGVHKPPKPRHRPGHVHVPPLISTSVPESSTVSEASLPHLPCELKIQIFGFMDSFSAVTALSSTSRTFNGIWKVNANHICDAILQRTLESPVEAKALIKAQQSTRPRKDKKKLKENQKDQNGYQQTTKRLQQYLANEDMASWSLESFEDRPTGRRLSSRDRAHFMQAYYRARVLVLLSTDGIPRSLITTWNMLDFKRVHEVLDYIYAHLYSEWPEENSAFISEEESEIVLGCHNPVCKLEVAIHRMDLLEDDVLPMLREIYPFGPDEDPDAERLRFFITYDLDVTTTDKIRGVPLAELLAHLPEWSLDRYVDFDKVLGRLDW